ncbi:hypothetical protein N0M98_20825 [Paenibacillus doosanensis]|uniref:hypothetical protein n=1 Tax=Paenibacillus doosanensis TaxID=1229154 RepID=UPI00217F7A67|nr:hypothetical protein [Paenibacillus doosanensis]MCS7462569.1 hypothetical protein [Paenibacillus doosanensis]
MENISIGNIIVRKEGDNTNVVGQIKVAESLPSANIGANISFQDQNGKELGFIVINEKLKAGINNFEAVGSGDFTNYVSLKFHIGALNGRIVK